MTAVGKLGAAAAARFFLRVAQSGNGPWRDEQTLPLFPLVLLMDAQGVLAQDARHLAEISR